MVSFYTATAIAVTSLRQSSRIGVRDPHLFIAHFGPLFPVHPKTECRTSTISLASIHTTQIVMDNAAGDTPEITQKVISIQTDKVKGPFPHRLF